MQDLRYAFRLLRRQPGYTAVIVGTMALGIAAVGVLTSITYGVLLKPLPWAAAPRLVRLNETRQGNTGRFRPMMTNGTYLAWRDSVTTLDGLGAWSTDNETLTESGDPTRIRIGQITPSLLPLLGASPMLGRAFTDGEESPGRPPIALISYGLWQRRYGGRATIVGDSLRLDGTSYTVVGVMPASFAFPDRETQAWVPFYIMPLVSPTNPGSFSLAIFGAIGRLKLGVTPAQAASEGTTRGRAAPSAPPIMMAVFGTNGPVEVSVVPLLDALTADVRPAILIMFAAVMLLLTVATANVANLQLARGTTRRRELAIRAALGADGARLARQCLVENLLLGLLGGCVGVLLAAIVHTTLPSLLPADFPRLGDLAFDARVQGFTIAIALLAAVGFGLLPALQAARESLVQALTDDSLAPVGGGTRSPTSRARAVIMAMQVALACVLLVGATLLIRSFVGTGPHRHRIRPAECPDGAPVAAGHHLFTRTPRGGARSDRRAALGGTGHHARGVWHDRAVQRRHVAVVVSAAAPRRQHGGCPDRRAHHQRRLFRRARPAGDRRARIHRNGRQGRPSGRHRQPRVLAKVPGRARARLDHPRERGRPRTDDRRRRRRRRASQRHRRATCRRST